MENKKVNNEVSSKKFKISNFNDHSLVFEMKGKDFDEVIKITIPHSFVVNDWASDFFDLIRTEWLTLTFLYAEKSGDKALIECVKAWNDHDFRNGGIKELNTTMLCKHDLYGSYLLLSDVSADMLFSCDEFVLKFDAFSIDELLAAWDKIHIKKRQQSPALMRFVSILAMANTFKSNIECRLVAQK
jgi:hypothetical protein